MVPDSRVSLTKPQLHLCTIMLLEYYCENVHLLRHRSEHTFVSAIYYLMDSVTRVMHYKIEHRFKLKPGPTILDAGDFIMLLNLPGPWTLVHALENRPFPLEYYTYRVISRTEFFEWFFQPKHITSPDNVYMSRQCSSNRWFALHLLCV